MGRCDRRFMSGAGRGGGGAQRGISGRLAIGSDLSGAGYRCKSLLAVGQVRT